ncbi:hypothetical protein Psal071_01088 [Piscirickettsia salmonis]|uniref:DUF2802 domain-containing protein n=3 Tax=Piscirickettsia salmonis TaxID=1238 RepID=A0A9Q6LK82_PISSA|nr:DUF2802 domain-containing protein [Piscirickettsia salmonis]QGN95591.1 hypothetical protein Psal006a_02211 [Piscirickettsia salmonis]QGO05460.1 hypothetical protein Psal009_01349 [Piscirickettsia salmonis]QGO33781.1 hypothetical protein Psal028_01096 [Piscirickettsia salmonis]QGO37391.1 hypothetical protein Psal040_01094 [Piscirickettsia salmonis]QGO41017.1 hypothetical protein Psal041_01095 [Piscirickettsia salmonis]
MMGLMIQGSFLAVLLLLLGVLCYLWRSIKHYRQQLCELQGHCHVFMSSSIGIGQRLALLERYLGRDLYKELGHDAFPEKEENLYRQAAKLAALGMGKKELAEGFDLTDTEAELLELMSTQPLNSPMASKKMAQPEKTVQKAQSQQHLNHPAIKRYKSHQQD